MHEVDEARKRYHQAEREYHEAEREERQTNEKYEAFIDDMRVAYRYVSTESLTNRELLAREKGRQYFQEMLSDIPQDVLLDQRHLDHRSAFIVSTVGPIAVSAFAGAIGGAINAIS